MVHRFTTIIAESDGLSILQRSLLIIFSIVVIIFLLNRMRRRRALDGSPRQYRRETDAANNKSTAIKRDMEQLLVELNELARQINARIDTKFTKLEQSIADADKRIQVLRVLLDAVKKAGLQRPRDEAAEPGGNAESNRPVPASAGAIDVRVQDDGIVEPSESDRAESESTSAPAAMPEPAHPSHHPDANSGSSANDEINCRIYQLADAGRTPVEIARELRRSVGEVELILNLR